jgi:hypothetical protein
LGLDGARDPACNGAMPPRSPDYSRKLARVIVLKDGRRLRTL